MKIGIAGHPEGSPNMSDQAIDEAMKSKSSFADYIVTQWTQDTNALSEFVNEAPLPVHVGLAGPASMKTLIKFAGFVGLKNTLSFAKKNASKIFDLCKTAGLNLTPIGSAFPYRRDQEDSNIRIAPTFVSIEDLEKGNANICLLREIGRRNGEELSFLKFLLLHKLGL